MRLVALSLPLGAGRPPDQAVLPDERATAAQLTALRGYVKQTVREAGDRLCWKAPPDTVVAGAVVAKATMRAVDVRQVEVGPWALREGIILRHLQTVVDDSPALPLRPVATIEVAVTGADVRDLAAGRRDRTPS